jgi:RNA polymerase sigma factor (sigma-70 family)
MTSQGEPVSVLDDSAVEDLDLVRAVVGGSIPAWHGFLERYSPVIYGVLRRYLFLADEEEVRTAFIEELVALFKGGLSKYRGESRLAVWLIVTTRTHAVDHWRKSQGRRHLPRHYDRLDDVDKKVLRMYFVDRLPLEVVISTMGWGTGPIGADKLVGSIHRIEETLGVRYLDQLEREYQSPGGGIRPRRLLKYMVAQRVEYEARAKNAEADADTIERESLEEAERVRRALSVCSAEERTICVMRFEKGWSARKIAEELKLDGERRVYTIINRVLRKLRRLLVVETDIDR